jgi:hypothetical protein
MGRRSSICCRSEGRTMTEENAILVCTVGGSHQPILTALKARQWERVVFVCTPET